MTVHLSESPGGHLDIDAGCIRAPASAAPLALATMERVNWVLGAVGCGLIFSGHWVDPADSWDGGCYHTPGPNAESLIVVALVEGAVVGQTAGLTFTPASGAAVDLIDSSIETGSDVWDGDWQTSVLPIDLATTGLQAHAWSASYCHLHALSVWEAPRLTLSAAGGDTCAERRAGSWAGLEVGRRITESDTAGLAALLATIRSGVNNCRKHFGWAIPTAQAWSMTSKEAWSNLMDDALGTSGGGFRFRARMNRSAETSQEHEVRVYARCTTSGAGDLRLRSAGTGDSVTFANLTDSWGWVSPDGGAKLDIDCTDIDTLIPEVYTDTAGPEVQLARVSCPES